MAKKTMRQLIRDWRNANAGTQKVVSQLPRIAGNECVTVIRDNFRLQGYDDGQSVQKWEGRKKSTDKKYNSRSGVKGSTFSAKNKILQQTGNLIDSIKYLITGKSVRIGVDLKVIPYAQIHNEGGIIPIKERRQVIHFRGVSQNIKSLKLTGRFASPGARGRKAPTYAQKVKIGAHDIKMPKRKYMPTDAEGPNRKMLTRIQAKVTREIDAAMKTFKK